jgi:DNA repair exonuclease SbcCD nuclease subunit
MAHGLAADDKYLEGRSSPITYRELGDADCDYIALGHVHIFRDLTRGRTPAFYSGSPSESTAPSVALVTLDPSNGVTARPLPIH